MVNFKTRIVSMICRVASWWTAVWQMKNGKKNKPLGHERCFVEPWKRKKSSCMSTGYPTMERKIEIERRRLPHCDRVARFVVNLE